MKKIIFPLLAVFLISCSSNKNTSIIIDDKIEPINVLVFVNNLTGKSISDDVNKDLLDINGLNTKNIIFHTEKNENIEYKYGIELIITDINISEYKQAPKTITHTSEIREKYRIYDKDGNVSIREVNFPVSATFSKQKEYKNCVVIAELYLFNFKNGKLLHNKSLKSSNSFNKIFVESTTADISFINRHISDNLTNASRTRLLKNDINNNTVEIFPSDMMVIDDAVIKIKRDISKFISQI